MKIFKWLIKLQLDIQQKPHIYHQSSTLSLITLIPSVWFLKIHNWIPWLCLCYQISTITLASNIYEDKPSTSQLTATRILTFQNRKQNSFIICCQNQVETMWCINSDIHMDWHVYTVPQQITNLQNNAWHHITIHWYLTESCTMSKVQVASRLLSIKLIMNK